jgi:TatD DNase family protein
MYPTLDAHAHLDPSHAPEDLVASGAVLAFSLSIAESERGLSRNDALIAWGVGCHPRFPRAQDKFDAGRFQELTERAAVVGEIGLDCGSRVPLETQLATFRQILGILSGTPRLVSIHSFQATSLILRELQRSPILIPVLHWWTGTVAETKKAVELGCYFSVHSAVARHSKFRLHVPLGRVLIESDHGLRDPPAAIPCRITWAEYLVAQQYNIKVNDLRQIVWTNFARIIYETNTAHLLPVSLAGIISRSKHS